MEEKPFRVALGSLGCKLNQAETEQLARQLAGAGYRLVSPREPADVYILNTCTVTRTADSKARQWLRAAYRQNPQALIVATGCYAERASEELARLPGVRLVLDNQEKPEVVRHLEEAYRHTPSSPAPSRDGLRTRSFIKIQDGCSRFCSYCIVPLVRGGEKSVPAGEVIAQVKSRVAEGYREVVLTGTEVGAYSHDELDLKGLLERVLAETDISRLRLSSLQPPEISPDLMELWRSERLCRHFHLSLQSGSDTVLRRMDRRYTMAQYEEAVALIRSAAPEVAITTDVIAGFPGETEQEFQESYRFCQNIGFARIHVFPFSPRPGTVAAGLPSQVEAKIKKERVEKMLTLAKESSLAFRQKFLGQTLPVLWEQESGGYYSGLTGNYIKVYTKSDKELTNRITKVKLERVCREKVLAKE